MMDGRAIRRQYRDEIKTLEDQDQKKPKMKMKKVEDQPYSFKGTHVFWQPEQAQEFIIKVSDKQKFLDKYKDRNDVQINFVSDTTATLRAKQKDFESIASDGDLVRYEISRPLFPCK